MGSQLRARNEFEDAARRRKVDALVSVIEKMLTALSPGALRSDLFFKAAGTAEIMTDGQWLTMAHIANVRSASETTRAEVIASLRRLAVWSKETEAPSLDPFGGPA